MVMGWRELSSGVRESEAFVDLLPFPAARWSHDRRACGFNRYTSRLLGFTERDYSSKDFLGLWTDRIHFPSNGYGKIRNR
jgi:hypothetical protein